MPKSIVIEPEQVFARDTIHLSDIPVNAYQKTMEEELAAYSREDFLAIWQDMCAIREFETILNEIKTKGAYKGVTYNHAGPAHLSIGQEAAAVGMAFALTPDDHIFGSHRSHGEILAKGFSAIRQLSDERLLEIMEATATARCCARWKRDTRERVQGLALRFFVYGAYSEIFARETGFNRGLGGSMHAFFTPFGIYPNNAIVGGSGSIAPGAALFKRVNRKPGIVVCNIGDASFGCGPVWEGITFSAMDQYRKLWDESLGGGLPIVFNCMNNFYGMGGQPLGETMGVQFIARIGAGVNPEQMHAERVNGYDPLPVIDAFRRKKQMLAEGRGPVLLDTVTYRISGHSPSDASSYRSKEEIEHWQQADSIRAFRDKLIAGGVADEEALESARAASKTVFEMFQPGRRSRDQPAHRHGFRAGRQRDVLQPAGGEVRRPPAGVPAGPRGQSAGAADPRQDPHPHRRRQAGAEDEGLQHARRHLRGDAAPLLHRPHDDRVRRREPRLGRRLRRLSRPDRSAALPPAVQLADFRSRDRGRGRRLRAGRRPGGGRADVRRLHGPRGRRDLQPALEVAGHVGRAAAPCRWCCASRWAPSTARSTRRIGPRWCSTFPG